MDKLLRKVLDDMPEFSTLPQAIIDLRSGDRNYRKILEAASSLKILVIHDADVNTNANAESFIVEAAGMGLFNEEPPKRYPVSSDVCMATAHNLVRRDYIVRHATESDLPRLCRLEELCWQHTRSTKTRIRARVQKYPQGQFVLEREGTVLGVIYSQRIADVEALEKQNAGNVHRLHDESGSNIQLLALNIDPIVQNMSLGDQLLEFMLQRCSIVDGVNWVTGVTLCKNFKPDGDFSFDEYIQLQGSEQDPVLAFHQAHGARIVKPVANYRPEDINNQTYGVLIAYDIHHRVPQRQKKKEEKRGKQHVTLTQEEISRFVQEAAVRMLNDGNPGIENTDPIDPDCPIMETGLGSAELLKLQLLLEQEYEQKFRPAFFFEYNTLAKVIAYLTVRLATPEQPKSIKTIKKPINPLKDISSNDIAVIGMSCRLPGGIETPEQLWHILASGQSVIGTFPETRGSWPSSAEFPAIERGGFLQDGEMFDAPFFRISAAEAQITDPQQRILLELAWSCLEDAGMLPKEMKGSDTGVFIGASNGDYGRLIQSAGLETPAHYATGNSLAVLANRISYFFDFSGPSMLVDTACSSSLVTLHTAMQSLRAGECSVALAGGVNFICHPDLSIAYHKAGMLASDGKCKVFDAAANGYVRAEGAVMLMLKPLQKAIDDRDNIHAIIKGSAVNHGGLAGGLTVPNPQKQSELLTAAWKNAGISPYELSYIEAHGTGTSLGDPIEMQGMQTAYAACVGTTETSLMCGIGSVKSNLGHLESAAGLTGLLKVILSMKHKELPASIHFKQLNPKIVLDDTPFYIVAQNQAWSVEGDRPRLAGVSSFGSGGANAHVVIEEYIDEYVHGAMQRDIPDEDYLFMLSAANEERLQKYVRKTIDWLSSANDRDFADAIYTWQTGRTAMKQRLAIKVKNQDDLRNKLLQWLRDPKSLDVMEPPIAKDREHTQKRISLPTYPFARERYWIDTPVTSEQEKTGKTMGYVLAVPMWESLIPRSEGSVRNIISRHHVMLCDNERYNYIDYALTCFEKLQKILLDKPQGKVLFQIVIQDDGEQGIFAGLSGLLKTASRENPQLIGQIILTDKDPASEETASQLRYEKDRIEGKFGNAAADDFIRYQQGVRQVLCWKAVRTCRMDESIQPIYEHQPVAFKDHGVYLITGGLGGLGMLFAQEIARQTTKSHIVLTGRAALSEQQRKILEQRGITFEYKQLDLEDSDAVKQLIADIVEKHKQLNGIIHSAGMIADNFLLKKTPEEFKQVLSPKVIGTLHLDEASSHIDLDFMVLFSSVVSAIGNPGQADYAAANGFMDQFAGYRNSLVNNGKRRGQTLSINWPLWQEGGMRVDPVSLDVWRQTTGMQPMRTSTGMQAFHYCLSLGYSQAMVMEGDIDVMLDTIKANPIKENPIPISNRTSVEINQSNQVLYEDTLKRIKTIFGEVMGFPVAKIDVHESFSTYGIDSIFINKLNLKLAQVFGEISKTLFFEYRTLAELTSYLVSSLSPSISSSLSPSLSPSPPAPLPLTGEGSLKGGSGREIAIIGISGIYPQAATLDEFWLNLKAGKNCIREVPADRWALDGFYEVDPEQAVLQGKSYSKWGGWIEQFAEFDPLFFNISPREAMNIDPQERLFLQECWRALENAGYTRSDLKHRYRQRVGVFAGITKAGFNLYSMQIQMQTQMAHGNGFFPYTSFSSVANRVSYFLDITGPSMPVDTMCSSSLTAIHEACEHIRRGECEMAFAGGVNLYLHPSTYTWLCSQQMLSRDGLCRSFGAGGNGYVPGEGVGVVLLKPLSDAIKDGDHIHGVILSTHINHGGKANAYTVPNPKAQAELIRGAMEKANIKATDIGYIEAHGTGTELGDPIEISGLQQAFEPSNSSSRIGNHGYCKIGSAKSNIGHLEAAAGIAGLTKVLLQMQHRQIAPSLHAEKLNPNIAFDKSAFCVNRHLASWDTTNKGPRIAGISSFGAGGANAHIIVQEYLAPESVHAPEEQCMIPLSARTQEQLRQKALDLLQWIRSAEQTPDLTAMAYTLQLGREAMEERAGFLVRSVAQLMEKLEAYAAGKQDIEDVYLGQVGSGRAALRLLSDDDDFEETLEKWFARRKFSKLLELWTKGFHLDWNKLYNGHPHPHRIALPAYPFAKERYWIDEINIEAEKETANAAALHPLLHRNSSDLSRQSYTSIFTGKEFFLKDHKVHENSVLPAVAYLEMARAAVELASPEPMKTGVVELRNTVWAQPIAMLPQETKAVTIALFLNAEQVEFEITTQETLHCQGQAVFSHESVPPQIDIKKLQAGMRKETWNASSLYAIFDEMGIHYGAAHRAVHAVYLGERQALAQLKLPDIAEPSFNAYFMHPSLMDSALQATVCLLMDAGKHDKPLLPFSLDILRVYSPCTAQMFAWIRYSEAKFDVDLCDHQGNICVQMHGFSSRVLELKKESSAALHALVPVWNLMKKEDTKDSASENIQILLLGGSPAQLNWVRQSYPQAQSLSQLQSMPSIDTDHFSHLLWIAPDENEDIQDIVAQQESGVFAIFRIVKHLLSLGYAEKEVRWTFITRNTQRVNKSDRISPTHAGVSGLVGSLAKEYPQWRIRLLDVDDLNALTASACLSLPWSAQGDAWAYRQGEWFSQGLAQVADFSDANIEHVPYRQQGVYVVIGGAGGIGEVWSRFMAEHYHAKMVWIGRKPIDAIIEDKIRAIGHSNHAPLYFSADATDRDSLQCAYDAILKIYPTIHGVVHSAIVLQDQSIAQMDENTFRQSLAAKVDVSVNMEQVFGNGNLDFMLFFSSLISFTKAPGQSNYAAGCTFKDSFAHYVSQRHSYPVKIMNWGYWGSVGIVTSEYYNKRMQQLGIGSIEPQEAMTSLQALMGAGISQMALMKTLDAQAVAEISLPEQIHCFSEGDGSIPILLQAKNAISKTMSCKVDAMDVLKGSTLSQEMLDLSTVIMTASLASMDLLGQHAVLANPLHQRWLDTSVEYLRQQKLLDPTRKLDDIWMDWDKKKAAWLSNPNMQAQTILLEACLKALPDILLGKKLATDVMFPDSSMQLVEGIYQRNALADFYNRVLGETLSVCIRQKVQNLKSGGQSGISGIRILEIGAGTGGTTAKILPLLDEYRNVIDEYCYTDLSKAFLIHAEQHYKPKFPALTTAIFDVSQPLSAQAIEERRYDFVIATNVLHATRNIRETLRNAKAALKTHGVLLLNEMSVWSLFNHLTFGLLDGWWLYEDPALRLPGSPGLAPEKWQKVLTEEGFECVFFPAQEAHDLGQQVIVASSDGIVRQRIASMPVSKPISKPVSKPISKPVPIVVSEGSEENLRERTISYLQEIVAKTLRMEPSQIEPNRPLSEYGLDSILVVGLTSQLRKVFTNITSTLFFEVQNLNGLASYLLENKKQDLINLIGTETTPQQSQKSQKSQQHQQPALEVLQRPQRQARPQSTAIHRDVAGYGNFDVAIIGLSGRYPGAADLNEFWKKLSNGTNCISEVPKDRWDWKAYYDEEKGKAGKIYTKWGGFLEDIDKFDPLFFKVSPKEAKGMDPQERLFLEICYHAIEDAGYTPESLGEAEKIGVFAGVMNARYTTQPLHYSIANRVSYLLNFQGPSMAVDTACSASLTAIHVALDSLYSGLSECAIAGGVNLIIDPVHYLELSALTMLSGGSQCKAFGDGADGFVDAEGVGAVVLKPLWKAERDGDHIYGVIKGSAINAGGKTNGYTVPNPKAQSAVVSKALERANIPAAHISYIEAHGTGTALGDPIEIAGLTRAFQHPTLHPTLYPTLYPTKQFCAIGSLKSIIGHCESAAGIAGLTKVLLQLQHRKIVPTLHADVTNTEIDFSQTPFKIQRSLEEWKRPQFEMNGTMTEIPRIAGISSFGAGGANAHLIVQEYIAPEIAKTEKIGNTENIGAVILLSARTAVQLKQKVHDLLAYIRTSKPVAIDLHAMAYTLQVGREALEERLGFVVHSIEELERKLDFCSNDEKNIDGMCRGLVKHGRDMATSGADFHQTLERAIAEKQLLNLLDWWTKGLRLDWNRLYDGGKPKRISLPVYPFARERYWRDRVDVPQISSISLISSKSAVLHPLLHRNVSNMMQQCYVSTFDGNETFLATHRSYEGVEYKVFSAAACLEMARAAILDATSAMSIELCNIVWADPIVISNNRQISIALFAKGSERLDFEIYSVRKDGNDIVHCQGQALLNVQVTPLYISTGEMQLLGEIKIFDVAEAYADFPNNGFVLHPIMLDRALQIAAGSISQNSNQSLPLPLPLALRSLRIVRACDACNASEKEMLVWIRVASKTDMRLDVDLCDRQGNVCIQMRGIAYEYAEYEECAEHVAHIAHTELSDGIVLDDPHPETFASNTSNALTKPTKISLSTAE